jgi:hypothetical protein
VLAHLVICACSFSSLPLNTQAYLDHVHYIVGAPNYPTVLQNVAMFTMINKQAAYTCLFSYVVSCKKEKGQLLSLFGYLMSFFSGFMIDMRTLGFSNVKLNGIHVI